MIRAADIQRIVAEHYGISLEEMSRPLNRGLGRNGRNPRKVSEPRQIAMFLVRRVTHKSYPNIGRLFGNRDHSTVIHAEQKIERMCAQDGAFAKEVNDLCLTVQSTGDKPHLATFPQFAEEA